MITSLNLFYSQKSDLLPVRQRFQTHPSQQTLIQVFSGRVRRSQIETILADLTEVFPNTPIIGTTTAGEIFHGQVEDNTVVLSFSFFESTLVTSSLVNCDRDLQSVGKTLANDFVDSQPQALILFGCSIKDGNKTNATQLLTTLAEALPNTIIAGGQAGDNGNGAITYVFSEKGIVDYGAAAASLTGQHLVANNTFNLSWIPIGKKFKITKVVGQRVYRIDDRTPLELYNHYLGSQVVAELPLSAADFPLMTEREGMMMAIHPLVINDDGSFDYIYGFDLGEQVQFGFCHSGLLQTEADKTFEQLQKKPIQTAFIYSCVSRKWILGRDVDLEIAPVEKLASTAGFFAYGEYFTHAPGKCLHFGQTMTVLTLAETDKIELTSVDKKLKSWVVEQDSKQLKTLRVLHQLVETSAKETELANQKLAEMAHKDGLTGLLNRRYFDCRFADEFRLARRTKAPLSLIMIDVDEFKLYNDTYGHIKGDMCLCTVADILKQVAQRTEDVVCRYGGEEFVYILPNTDFAGAMNLAELVRRDCGKLAVPHVTSRVANYLTVSIGVQTATILSEQMTPEKLLDLCDKQLYLAKKNGRDRVCGEQL